MKRSLRAVKSNRIFSGSGLKNFFIVAFLLSVVGTCSFGQCGTPNPCYQCNGNTIVVDQNVTINFNTLIPTYSGDPDLQPFFTYDKSGATPDTWKAIFDVGTNKLLIKNGATITVTNVPNSGNNQYAPGIVIKSACHFEMEPGSHVIINSLNKQAGDILILVNGDIVINGEVRNEVSGTNGLPGAITISSKCGNLTEGSTGLIVILGGDFGGNVISLFDCGANNNGNIVINGLVKSFAVAHAGDLTLHRPDIKVVALNGSVTINANTTEPLFDEFAMGGGLYDIYGGLLSWVKDNVNPGKVEVQARYDITVNGHGIDPTGPVRESFGAIAAIGTASSAPGGLVDVRSLEGRILGNDRAFDVSGRNRLSTNFAHIRLWAKLNILLNRLGANNNYNPVLDASSPTVGDKGGTNEIRSYRGSIIIGVNALVSATVPPGSGSVQGTNLLTSCVGITNNGTIDPPDGTNGDDAGVCAAAAPPALFTDCLTLGGTFDVFIDTEPPVFTFCPPGGDLGCNPTSFPPPGNATATDNSGVVVSITSTLGDPSNTGGCNWTRTRTYVATDGCGNTATCLQVFIWTEATAPQFSNCGQVVDLGCNPINIPNCGGIARGLVANIDVVPLGPPTATNECGPVPVNCSEGLVTTNGCNRQKILTYTATACNLTSTCTRTYNWTIVTAPHFSNCGQVYDLGCNPTSLPNCETYQNFQTAGLVTATNECGPVTVNCSVGSTTTNGCNRQRIITFTATACNLTSTCTRTYNWTLVTAPQFSNCGQVVDLGCNPTFIPVCGGIARGTVSSIDVIPVGPPTATNECGPVTVNCIDGLVTSNGCNRQKILTYVATACNLTSTCTRTYNWTVVTAPQFSNCGQVYDLGCNPTSLPNCETYQNFQQAGLVTATNECGPVTVNCSVGSTTTNGCNRQRIITFTATACNLTSTCTRTYNWTLVTAPQFSNCGQRYDLGCNPTSLPNCETYQNFQQAGLVTATNECGPVTVNCSVGSTTTNGCNRQRIITFTATACNLTSTCTRTYDWTLVTAPQFSNCGQRYDLGCNPTSLPNCETYQNFQTAGLVTATNECGPVTVNCSVGSTTTNGCNRQRIITFTATACNLTSTCTRTYDWTLVTAPQFSNCGQVYDLGCNPTSLPNCETYQNFQTAGLVTATNECGPVTVNCSVGSTTTNGCNRQRIITFTATACNLTSTCTRTYNWTLVTAPQFSNCGQVVDLGCNPTFIPVCGGIARGTVANIASIDVIPVGPPTATNECGPVTVNCIDGLVTSNGCNRQKILTYVATACNLTSTCTRTYNWTVVTAPQFSNCGQVYDLGCNPTSLPNCETYQNFQQAGLVTATNECGSVTVNCSVGSTTTNGCNRQRIITFTATACNLTSTCTRTYNWTLVTAPQFSNCGQRYDLGCNPTSLPNCETYQNFQQAGLVTATNECGPVTVNCSVGSTTTNGCNRQRIITFTATACNLTSTCTRTYDWTLVTAPQFSNCGQRYDLGCNPTSLPNCETYQNFQTAGLVTATNECGPVTVNCSVGSTTTNGCNRQRIITFTATACNLTSTCTRTYDWTLVTAPQFSNCGQVYDLGCNPTSLPNCETYQNFQTAGLVTATNECGPVTVNCSVGSTTTNGCNRQRIITFTATACNLTSTCTRTYNWTLVTAPQFSNCGQVVDLGCNPTFIPVCGGIARGTVANIASIDVIPVGPPTATNECGPVTVNCIDGLVTSNGCNRQKILTYVATACNLTSTCTRTYNWTVVTAPQFSNCGQVYDLGCNPTSLPNCETYQNFQQAGLVTATNECGPVTVNCSVGSTTTNGCNRQRIITFTATACNLTSTCTRTYNWTLVTAPQFSNCGQRYDLGCNPTSLPNCETYQNFQQAGLVTATNECGPVTVNCSVGSTTTNGCNRQRIITFTATACNLTSTCTRTYDWTLVTAPQFSNCGQRYDLGCNPTSLPNCETYQNFQTAGLVTATNECGPVTVNCSVGSTTTNGCNRQRIITFTATACNLTSTCTRTYDWTVVTAPQFSNCGQVYDLGCNPTPLPNCETYQNFQTAGLVTATNECGPVTVNCSVGSTTTNGCNRQRIITFTATACNLTSTCTRTYNWTLVTAPQFSNCGQVVDLGCNPTFIPVCGGIARGTVASIDVIPVGPPTATNECGPVTVNCIDGLVTTNGCNRQKILTYVATACNLTSTCTRTYNWTVVTAPQFTNCNRTHDLGCNPTTIPTCDNYAALLAAGAVTATNECGPVTVNCSAATTTTNGCNRQRILTFTATACNLTSTCTRTYNWTLVTAPQFSNCGQRYDLGCNPTLLPNCDTYQNFQTAGLVTATNECGPVTVNCSVGSTTTNGCNRQRVITFTATACNLTSTCTRTYDWTVVTAPQFSNCGQVVDLGCNPTFIPVCGGIARGTVASIDVIPAGPPTATNECGPVTVNCIDGLVTSNGCNRQKILTYVATACNLTSTCTRTYNWTVVTAPQFTNCNRIHDLGCNPTTIPTCDNYASLLAAGAVTATNECGPVTVNCSVGSTTTNGCNRQRIITFTATACNLTSTCTRTYNWTLVTAPQFTNCNRTHDLGCNPTTIPTCDNYASLLAAGAVTATNECGTVTVNCSAATTTTNGCNRQRILTFTATACNLTSTCTRTYNWTVVTAPVFSNCGQVVDLGCNPTFIPVCGGIARGTVASIDVIPAGPPTATNECGPVSVNCIDGLVTSNGCNRQKILTYVATACNLTSTCTRTYNWTVVTAPVFGNCTTGTTDLGCNPLVLPVCQNITATNECGPVSVNCTPGLVQTNGCIRTQVFTYTATGCGLTSTCTRTFTWKIDITPPELTIPCVQCEDGVIVVDQNVTINFNTAIPTYSGDPDLQPFFHYDNTGATPDKWMAIFNLGARKLLIKNGATITTTQVGSGNNKYAPGIVIRSLCSLEIENGGAVIVNSLNKQAGDILIQISGDILINGVVRNEVSGTNGLPGAITIVSKCGNITEGSTGLVEINGQDFGGNTITIVTCGEGDATGDITISGLMKSYARAHAGDQNLNRPKIKVISFDGNVTVNANTVEPLYDEFQESGTRYDLYGGLLAWVRDNVIPGSVEVQAKLNVTVNGHGNDPTGPVRTSFGAIAAIATASSAPGGLVDVRSLEGNIFGNDRAFDVSGRNRLAVNYANIKLNAKANIVLNRLGATNDFGLVVDASSPTVGDKGGKNELRSYSGSITIGANALVSAAVPAGSGSVQGTNLLTACVGVTNSGTVIPADANVADNSGVCVPVAPTGTYLTCIPYFPPENFLGCNPTDAEIDEALGHATVVFDLCGPIIPVETTEPVVVLPDCFRSQTRTWVATDACGNTSSASVTVTWKVCPCNDAITNNGGRVALPRGELGVTAFPNPYTDYFVLRITPPVSGTAVIEIFTTTGAKIAEIKETALANAVMFVHYYVPELIRSRLVYKVTIGEYKKSGIILSPN